MHNYFKICLGKAAIAIINLLLLGNVLLLNGCGNNTTPQADQTEKVKELKQENNRLAKQIEAIKQSSQTDQTQEVEKLKQENDRLTKQIEAIKQSSQTDQTQEVEDLKEKNAKLQQEKENRKAQADSKKKLWEGCVRQIDYTNQLHQLDIIETEDSLPIEESLRNQKQDLWKLLDEVKKTMDQFPAE